jgi:hypothetical protein
MDPELRALQDTIEIHELLARYARGVDTRDWPLYRSVFTPDARLDYTAAGAIAGTVDEIVSFFEEVFTTIPWSFHQISNIEVDLDGDRATVRALFNNPMQLPGMDGPSCCVGTYHHEMVRTAAGWRSERLVEENEWAFNQPGG